MPVANLAPQQLTDRESAYYAPRSGDALLLALVVGVLLINGVILWRQLGPSQEHVRRAMFFGLLLLCVYWAAVVYTFKLSVSARIGPHGLAIVRGPWRTELAWREVARLVERVQTTRGQRYRWVIAFARDGRRLQIREDMVASYQRFRYEVYERYRLWQDHGGTWATGGSGPFTARELVAGKIVWWLVLAGLVLLPGIYFTLFLPDETHLLGPALLGAATLCALLAVRVALRRSTYTVDAKMLTASRFARRMQLTWREVARVDRARHPFGGVLSAGIVVGRFCVQLAARTDPRVQSFAWYPRVPEYLTLRGAGYHIRIALHRVARPDELLAWIEFYERVGRRAAAGAPARATGAPARQSQPSMDRPARDLSPLDLSGAEGPLDPFAASAPAEAPKGPRGDDAAAAAWLTTSQPGEWSGSLPRAQEPDRSDDEGKADEASEADARGRSSWQEPTEGTTGLAGSLDQLWAESQVEPAWGADSSTAMPERTRDWERPGVASAAAGGDSLDAIFGPDTLPEPERADDAPTASVENRTDTFAPWRTDPHWTPPQLPRFGPPPTPPSAPPSKEEEDPGAFSDDEFLR
jgi:hypothetical protein